MYIFSPQGLYNFSLQKQLFLDLKTNFFKQYMGYLDGSSFTTFVKIATH